MLNNALRLNRSRQNKYSILLPLINVNANYIGAFQGALNTTTITLSIKLNIVSSNIRLFYSKNSDLSNYSYSNLFSTDSNGWCKITLNGLDINSTYYWTVVNDDKRSSSTGTFKTLNNTYNSFKIVASSCADTNSNNTVFSSIKNEFPLLFQHMGDLHYADINTNDVNLYRLEYERLFTLSNQKTLYENTPLAYIWDDHDYGANNSGASSSSRTAARSAYRSYIPSYTLPSTGAIYYSYAIDNVLFVVTDNRSERSLVSNTDNSSKTVLGTEQKQWFKDTLLAAKGVYKGVVWYNSFPWLGNAFSDDEWCYYATERTELATYIKTNEIPLLAIICGDAHMIAIDNGSANEIYGVPTYQFASLDQTNSVKGSGYSHGTFPGNSQYGVLDFTNNGYLQLVGTGKNSNNNVISKHTTFATKWIAYNDCYGTSTSNTKITNQIYSTTETVFNLVNYKTASNLGITMSCTYTGNGVVNTTNPVLGTTLTHLTDLHDRFINIMSSDFVTIEVNSTSTFTIKLNNLDVTKYYLIECSSDRGNSSYNNQRGIKVDINNYSELTNLSSNGVIVNNVNSISYSSGYNTINGYIVRWVIKPSNSTIIINSNYDTVNYPTGAKAYPIKYMCIGELL